MSEVNPPEITPMAARRIAVLHATATTEELPETFARLFPAVYAALTEQGVTDMGHVCAVYHTMDEHTMDLSAGIEVGAGVEVSDPLDLLEIAAGEAIKADHIGPYDQLHVTHTALHEAYDASGRAGRGGPIERYITDPEAEPDPSKWHTEIWLPLE